jgi:hypothetical protein
VSDDNKARNPLTICSPDRSTGTTAAFSAGAVTVYGSLRGLVPWNERYGQPNSYLSDFLNGECVFCGFVSKNASYLPTQQALDSEKITRSQYSMRDRVTIEGVPVDRRSDSFVASSG